MASHRVGPFLRSIRVLRTIFVALAVITHPISLTLRFTYIGGFISDVVPFIGGFLSLSCIVLALISTAYYLAQLIWTSKTPFHRHSKSRRVQNIIRISRWLFPNGLVVMLLAIDMLVHRDDWFHRPLHFLGALFALFTVSSFFLSHFSCG